MNHGQTARATQEAIGKAGADTGEPGAEARGTWVAGLCTFGRAQNLTMAWIRRVPNGWHHVRGGSRQKKPGDEAWKAPKERFEHGELIVARCFRETLRTRRWTILRTLTTFVRELEALLGNLRKCGCFWNGTVEDCC